VWTTYFNQQVKHIFLFLNRLGFNTIWILTIILILPFIILRLLKNGKIKNYHYGIIASIATIGFSGISLEVIIILAFQAIYGYVYFQLALILSSFMVGLAAGSNLAITYLKTAHNVFQRFKVFQLSMALYAIFLIIVLKGLGNYSINSIFFQLIFSILTAVTGFITGYQYPLASHLYFKINPSVDKVAGTIYGFDLLGSCIGAFVTSALLIPILGIIQTCFALFLINFSLLCGLLLAQKNE
jgi:spermidine synthase